MKSFNRLTAAEAERLAVLSEELGEAQQAIGKILRHGFESRHPDGGPTNRQSLEREMGDVRAAEKMLIESGDLNCLTILDGARSKSERIKPYLHHQ